MILGGTGSLGKVLTRRILSGEMGRPKKIIRSVDRGNFYALHPILPELDLEKDAEQAFETEYSSALNLLSCTQTKEFLKKKKLMIENINFNDGEILR